MALASTLAEINQASASCVLTSCPYLSLYHLAWLQNDAGEMSADVEMAQVDDDATMQMQVEHHTTDRRSAMVGLSAGLAASTSPLFHPSTSLALSVSCNAASLMLVPLSSPLRGAENNLCEGFSPLLSPVFSPTLGCTPTLGCSAWT